MMLVLMLLLPLMVTAGPVSESEARQRARAFLFERGIAQLEAPMKRLMSKNRRAPGGAGSVCDYFVFNIGVEDGFVIVSGDDRTASILGYADSGSIDEGSMPDGLRYLLDGFAEQMATLDEGRPQAKAPSSSRSHISPLIVSRWDQRAPFNAYCPVIDGQRTPTGCVATAMAQVMYYYQWPENATTAIPGYTTRNNYFTLDALPETTFSWNAMTPTYGPVSSDFPTVITDAEAAVAQLMQYCGTSIQMNYDVGGSGAYNESLVDVLKYNYGYDSGITHAYRKNYSYLDWVNLIYGELAAHRPVVLGGQGTGGGHSFVCDGYDSGDYFHINWGWGGLSDGYFRLSALNPDEQGTGGSSTLDGYSYSQDAVIGIQPPVGGSKRYCLSLEGLNFGSPDTKVASKTFTRDDESAEFTGISLYLSLFSYQYGLHAFDYAVQLVDENGNVEQILYSVENQEMNFNDSKKPTFSVSIPSGVPDGNYYVKVVSRPNGSSEWQECFDGDRYQLAAVISGNNLTITVPITAAVLPTAVVFNVKGNMTKGYEQQVTASITGGAVDFHGNVILCDNQKAVMGKILDIPAGQTVDAHFTFIPTVAGEHTLALYPATKISTNTMVGSGTVIGSSSTVTILESDASDTQTIIVSPVIANISDGKLYGNALRVTATVTNPSADNSYASQLNCSLRTYDSAEDAVTDYVNATVQRRNITIEKNGTTKVSFEYTGLQVGKFYCLRFTYTQGYDDGGVTKYRTQEALITDRYQMGEGYLAYNADGTSTILPKPAGTINAGNALYLDLQSLSTVPAVTPSSNPNCVYLLPSGTAVPESLSACNVVCDGVANNLKLVDGHDFFTPIAFTADHATYTRTFNLAAARTSGWNTLFLPFTATAVTVQTGSSEKNVDWFHSDSDAGKHFWLREFTADGEGTVTFAEVGDDEIVANTPYIIAVPGDTWGDEWQITGKPVTFSGTDVYIDASPSSVEIEKEIFYGVSGNNFKFCGTTSTISLSEGYLLNSEGSCFKNLTEATNVEPFRAWFLPVSISSLTRPMLTITSPDATGINMPQMASLAFTGNESGWCTLDGRRLADKPTARGIYIYKGKKIAVK